MKTVDLTIGEVISGKYRKKIGKCSWWLQFRYWLISKLAGDRTVIYKAKIYWSDGVLFDMTEGGMFQNNIIVLSSSEETEKT